MTWEGIDPRLAIVPLGIWLLFVILRENYQQWTDLEQELQTAEVGSAEARKELEHAHRADLISGTIAVGGNANVTLINSHVTQTVETLEVAGEPMAGDLFENRRVRIGDVERDGDGVIRGKRFEGCTIVGPAILFPVGPVEYVLSTLGPDADTVVWEIAQGRRRLAGVLGLDDCVFERCKFLNIGFAGPSQLLADIRSLGTR